MYLASLPKFRHSVRLLGYLAFNARLIAHMVLSAHQYVREIERSWVIMLNARSCLMVALVGEHSKFARNASLAVPLYLVILFYFQF
jgi:hypothetical protein